MHTPFPARPVCRLFLAAVFGALTVIPAASAANIVVEQPADTALTSGASTVDFGSSAVGTVTSLIFTIRNAGPLNLTGIAVTVDGTNSGDFSVTTSPGVTVALLGRTTFTVAFNPKAGGARTAVMHIASSDTSLSPFNINLSGVGLAPVLAVEQPAGTVLAAGASKDFGSSPVGTAAALTFTIKNTGTASLTGTAVTIDGSNKADFTVTDSPPATVAHGESKTFTVAFNPTASGSRTATLHIASNDSTHNPYNIPLTGAGIAPVIVVTDSAGTGLTSGVSAVDFMSAVVNIPHSQSFTISNTGTADLTGISVTVGGTNGADFTVTTAPAATVAVNADTSFIVAFNPKVAGPHTATLHIASNDPTHNPFDVILTGNGMSSAAPLMVVEQPTGASLTSGSGTVGFGSALVAGTPKTLTFTIKNTGTADLADVAVTKDGTNSEEFTVTTTPAATVPVHGMTTFTVSFSATGSGTRFAILHVNSNDPNTPFDILVAGQGTLTSLPQIAVEQPVGTSLTPDVSNVSFPPSPVGTPVTVTFTIKNTGTADLTGLAATVTRYGIASKNYNVTTPPAATKVAPGDSTTCTVTFTPLIGGQLVGTLHITSNDPQHHKFDIYLNGRGLSKPQPVIAVEDDAGKSLRSGHSVVDFGSELTVGTPGASPYAMTFTIKNTGTADLTGVIAAVTKGDSTSPDFKVSAQPAATVAFGGGARTTVTVEFNPTATGRRTATLRIKGNSPSQRSFNIYLTGNGMGMNAPLIAVGKQDGTKLVAGIGKVNFGASLVDSAVTMMFTIRNLGTADLTGIKASVKGNNGADFPIITQAAGIVAPRESTTLTVNFNPKAGGAHSAVLQITSNELPPFDIPITGMGTVGGTVPAMAVEQPVGSCLTSGVSTVNFQTVSPSHTAEMTFTVRNALAARDLGSASNLRVTKVTVSGNNAGDFQVFMLPHMPIKPGSHTKFKVRFMPRSEGSKQATLTILSNDPLGSPFHVNLAATTLHKDATSIPAPLRTTLNSALPSISDAVDAGGEDDDDYDDDYGDDYGGGDLFAWLVQGIVDLAPFYVTVVVDDQDWQAISFRRWKSPGSLIYVVEESMDLMNWTPVPTPWQLAGPIEEDGYGCERLTVLASGPVIAGHESYLRVRVQDGL